jgi:arylsulfatase A
MKPIISFIAALLISSASHAKSPNILLIYADDLGYGEVSCYNPERSKIPTPHMDKLAKQGMRFTDAHSSSSVCSPSRYALLTGRYHWRSRLQAGIVGQWEKPLIAPDRLTLGGMLREHGYQTAMAGKWHLGWDWPIPEGKRALIPANQKKAATPTVEQKALWKELFSQDIPGGPVDRGFDRYFGTDVPNWPPFCFIENRRTIGIPSEFLPAETFLNNLASQQGPALADWKLEPILPAIRDRACQWIHEYAKSDKPFFLYLPLTAPHTPISVNEKWKGKSGLGAYGDFVMETDDTIGQVLSALEESGAAEYTLVILTSDNGNASYAGGKELEGKGHFPSGPLRGYKFDAWEGGHRVPFLVRWPGMVAADSRCDQLVHQADIFATVAEILDHKLPPNAGEDSFSLISLFSDPTKPIREMAVSHSANGVPALRLGHWKIIFGNGGKSQNGAGKQSAQLYNLADDLGETNNLYDQKTELVTELTTRMRSLVENGRSTLGPVQKNDVPVKWKQNTRK